MQKVLIVVPYSHPSKCGIWNRAWADAKFLKSQGYDVTIFSSDIVKGSNLRAGCYEDFEGIVIRRFRVYLSLGGTSMFWFFPRWFFKLNPDIVHVHGYRHPHSLQALLLSKIQGKRALITTHAPFEKDNNRSVFLKLIDFLYDILIGWWELKLYKKVIRISKWEEKYITKLGINNSVYIPNGISELFANSHPELENQPKNKAIFMGRVDPIKRLEWLKYASEQMPEINFLIKGPLDGYKEFIADNENLCLDLKKYEHSEFKRELALADAYILPSIREALPFTLLEAMSQGVIPFTSKTKGGQEVVTDGENGFVFENKEELVEKLKYLYSNWKNIKQIREAAILKAREYSLHKTNSELLSLYKSE